MITTRQFIDNCDSLDEAEVNAFDYMLDLFVGKMKTKFRQKVREGVVGWDILKVENFIRESMIKHARRGKGQEIDVALLAAMAWNMTQENTHAS